MEKTPRIIAILNFKGGTGKTTTTINLGTGLALAGKQVLMIDLDPQGTLATYFGIHYAQSLTHLLLEQATAYECIISARPNLDMIPADYELAHVIRILGNKPESEFLLRRLLRGLDDYDFILLDCSPTINLLSDNALRYAHEIFIPVPMDYLALVGARQVAIEVLSLRKNRPDQPVHIALIIPTFYQARYKKSAEVMDNLKKYFPNAVAEPIRATVRLSEASSHHQPIFEYEPGGIGATDYARLVERVLGYQPAWIES